MAHAPQDGPHREMLSESSELAHGAHCNPRSAPRASLRALAGDGVGRRFGVNVWIRVVLEGLDAKGVWACHNDALAVRYCLKTARVARSCQGFLSVLSGKRPITP